MQKAGSAVMLCIIVFSILLTQVDTIFRNSCEELFIISENLSDNFILSKLIFAIMFWNVA